MPLINEKVDHNAENRLCIYCIFISNPMTLPELRSQDMLTKKKIWRLRRPIWRINLTKMKWYKSITRSLNILNSRYKNCSKPFRIPKWIYAQCEDCHSHKIVLYKLQYNSYIYKYIYICIYVHTYISPIFKTSIKAQFIN